MASDGLDELLPNRIERIQRGERVLENRADAPAADAPHRFLREIVDAFAV